MATQRSTRVADPALEAQDTGTVAVRGVLARLSKRSGLSPERLVGTEIDVVALLRLPIIQECAARIGGPPEEVAPILIKNFAERLPATDRLIVDATLALGLLRESPPDSIDLDRLYRGDLGQRREYLVEQWQPLHHAHGAQTIPPPTTVRALRGGLERRALTALARLLTAETVFDATATQTDGPPTAASRGKVTVVGDAVLDHIYVVDRMPEPGSSTWCGFEESVGGKGLNRAVAAARLGLSAQLIAAVGDDAAGHQIRAYLRQQGVDTSLIGVVNKTPTPVTAVIMPSTGLPANMAARDGRLRLHADDLDTAERRRALAAADVVLLTFEQPVDVLMRALEIVAAEPKSPWVIVSASPPLNSSPRMLFRSLRSGSVHYLIGTPDELAELASGESAASGDVAERLLNLGVRTVCTIDGFQLTIRSRQGEFVVAEAATAMASSSGAYAAFATALAYRLAIGARAAAEEDFRWAAAAMTATQSVGMVSQVMPSVAEIDDLMRVEPTREKR